MRKYIRILWSDKVERGPVPFQLFVQKMANRLIVGHWRYGAPDKRQKYLTRMKKELEAYVKTGNVEQLINIANYAMLESIAPEHPQAHFDNTINSVTRHNFTGERREGD
jgi:hypothetical protein